MHDYIESMRRHNLLVQSLGGALQEGVQGYFGGRADAVRRQQALADLSSQRSWLESMEQAKEDAAERRARIMAAARMKAVEHPQLVNDPDFKAAIALKDPDMINNAMRRFEAMGVGVKDRPAAPAVPPAPSFVRGSLPEQLSIPGTMGEASEQLRSQEHPLSYEKEAPLWPWSRGVALGTGTAAPSLSPGNLSPPEEPSPVILGPTSGQPGQPAVTTMADLARERGELLGSYGHRAALRAGEKSKAQMEPHFALEAIKADNALSNHEISQLNDVDRAEYTNKGKMLIKQIELATKDNPDDVARLINNAKDVMGNMSKAMRENIQKRAETVRSRRGLKPRTPFVTQPPPPPPPPSTPPAARNPNESYLDWKKRTGG